MASHLFSPIDLNALRLDNRIVVAPMCQYSASEGRIGDYPVGVPMVGVESSCRAIVTSAVETSPSPSVMV